MAYDTDDAKRESAAKKILEAQADNLWVIGTVGLGSQPIIVSNDLKNISEKGLWDSKFRYMNPMYPVQFYLDK